MKKSLIASIAGGIIIFFWQFLSNAALDLHRPASQSTPQQDSILAFLSTHLKEGKYFLPNTPDNASNEEKQKTRFFLLLFLLPASTIPKAYLTTVTTPLLTPLSPEELL